MNRRLLSYVALLTGLVQIPDAAAQSWGLTVGLNYQQLSNISINDLNTRFDSKQGWHIGAWFEFNIGSVGIRPGVRYVEAGQLLEGLNETFPATRDNFDVSLLEANLLFRYGIEAPVIGPYVFAGPLFRFPSFTDKVIGNDLAPMSVSGEIGAGLQITIGSIRLYPEVAYTFGFTNFIEDELVIDFVSLTPNDAARLNTAMLRLSIGL